ncbi:amino acid adenylation domain-containing protein [Leptothoe sp. ISB3NOV94-8A]
MDLYSLLNYFSSHGVKLSLYGDALEVDAPKGAITPDISCSITQHKAELLSLLHQYSEVLNVNINQLPNVAPRPEDRYKPFPLTDMQHAFWVGRSGALELGEVANHGYYEIESYDLDLEKLNLALQQLIDRHDMLRAIVLPDGQQQVLKKVPPYQIEILDLRSQPDPVVKARINDIRHRMSHQVLPADQYPLFEFRATRLDKGKIRLHISYDLQIFDAWSLFRLFDEWFQLYQASNAELVPLEISFRDYVLAEQSLQETQQYRQSQDYWLNRLDTLPPAPDLPLAKRPSDLQHHRCRRYEGGLEQSVWQALKQKAAQAGLTPSGLLLSAFSEILAVWSKIPRFTINLALFNRLPMHPQVSHILGDFTSVTLLEADHSVPKSFADQAVQLQQQLWRDLEHRYFSGVRVVRELSRKRGTAPSAMPIIFTSTLGFSSLGQDTRTFSHFGKLVYGISQASQAWIDVQVWEENNTLTFNWDVVEELFPQGLVDDMFSAYCRFLQKLASSESAWTETSRQFALPNQLNQRSKANAKLIPIPEITLHQLFIEQVKLRDKEVAVISSRRNLTYQEVYELSKQVGHRLRALGVRPNQLVAIVMEKGWEQIVAVMGTLLAGAAYVPISPELPQERLSYLLENSKARIVLTQSWLKQLQYPSEIHCLDVDDIDQFSLADESTEDLELVQGSDDLAYVIYTSGSTGNPKGVMISHRNVINVVVNTNQRFNIDACDRILALTALNHDLSVYDIFGLLSTGGAIVLPDAALVKEPAHWASLLQQHRVTLWNSVPAMMEMLVRYADSHSRSLPDSLRLAILGGDWLPVSLPNQVRALVPQIQILSIGGPTETTIWNIGYLIEEVDPNWQSIPYGQPMANSQYYILNDALEDCPVWVPGQMHCAGVQLAQGYWRNKEKTEANFIQHPRTGERIYQTGDLGRYLPDGNIEFLGRVDFQIKLRGYRIEPGEVEATLMQHQSIKNAVVTTLKNTHENQALVAYIVLQPGEESGLLQIERANSSKHQQQWQDLLRAGYKQAEQTFWTLDRSTFSAYWDYQNHLHLISVCKALKKLGIYQSIGDAYTLDEIIVQCQIAPRYRKWLLRGLKTLIKAGLLEQQGQHFKSIADLPATVFQPLTAEIQSSLSCSDEFMQNWIALMPKTPLEELADIITEKIHSAEIYTSDNTQTIYQLMFADCNAISKAVMSAYLNTLEPDRPLRVLEVGAGYGTTAIHLLPLFSPERTTYVFTDISNFFLQRAQECFADYSFIEYNRFDLEKDPYQQGYAPHSFDIIIAATVLHNTRSIEESLRHIRALLAPNGLLLAIEKTRFHPAFDLNMGLQQGFERFEDNSLRPEHPVPSKEQWQSVLCHLGFENSTFLNRPDSVADDIGFDVLVAQGPSSVKQFKPERLQNFLNKKLPEYMVPHQFVLLDALPLTANGKVDRLSLSTLKGLHSQAKATYVVPQNDMEQLVASVWQEILQIERIGSQDNFFALGGDSLQATQVLSRLREKLKINLSVQRLLETPTLAALADSIEKFQQITQKLQAPIDVASSQRMEIKL